MLPAAACAFRQSVLTHLRVLAVAQPGPSATASVQGQPRSGSLPVVLARFFAGGFLDKDKVTERVMYVTKHFEKVDPAKVRGAVNAHGRAKFSSAPWSACSRSCADGISWAIQMDQPPGCMQAGRP
jgi:hypothetical protein